MRISAIRSGGDLQLTSSTISRTVDRRRIVQTRDLRKLESRHDVRVGKGAQYPRVGDRAWQLQRHLPPESTIGTWCQPHFGHTPAPSGRSTGRVRRVPPVRGRCGGRFALVAARAPLPRQASRAAAAPLLATTRRTMAGQGPVLGWQCLEPGAARPDRGKSPHRGRRLIRLIWPIDSPSAPPERCIADLWRR